MPTLIAALILPARYDAAVPTTFYRFVCDFVPVTVAFTDPPLPLPRYCTRCGSMICARCHMRWVYCRVDGCAHGYGCCRCVAVYVIVAVHLRTRVGRWVSIDLRCRYAQIRLPSGCGCRYVVR